MTTGANAYIHHWESDALALDGVIIREMENKNKMRNMDIWNIIQKKWEEILTLFKENYNPKKETLIAKLEHGDIPHLVLKDRGTKSETTNFIVRYEERILKSKESSGADVLVDFIRMVGAEKVYAAKIRANRCKELVSKTDNDNEDNSPKYVDGYYVFTKSENPEKMMQILDIINRLELAGATIERDFS
ncbi:MAG: hypothetical protein K6E93_10400 [Bacteroidales bacterium]|nr:hypothetical protein [Bacteroidales bacterium]